MHFALSQLYKDWILYPFKATRRVTRSPYRNGTESIALLSRWDASDEDLYTPFVRSIEWKSDIQELPNEVFLQVLASLPSETLKTIRLLCRRLNRLATAEILHRAQIRVSESGRCTIPVERSTQSFRLVPIIPSLQHLSLILSPSEHFLLDLTVDRLLTLTLSRLAKLPEIYLQLPASADMNGLLPLLQTYLPGQHAKVLILRNTNLGVSRPRRVLKMSSPFLQHWKGLDPPETRSYRYACLPPYFWLCVDCFPNIYLNGRIWQVPFWILAWMAMLVSYLVDVIYSIGFHVYRVVEFQEQGRRVLEDITVNDDGSIESIEIRESPDPYYSKFISVNVARIKTLTLRPIPRVSWNQVFQMLDGLCDLEELDIADDSNLDMSLLSTFISSHPSIKRLQLGHGSLANRDGEIAFADVQVITAPAVYIPKLVQGSSRLRSINIAHHDCRPRSFFSSFSLEELDLAFEAIANLNPMPAQLGLAIPGGSKTRRWFCKRDLEAGRVESRLTGVTHLAIDSKFNSKDLEHLVGWLNLFTELKRVTLLVDAVVKDQARVLVTERCPGISVELVTASEDDFFHTVFYY
ncbi:hypothetical protein C8J56DRAFT_938635 [Mycena floridula]|nr:hypothetical protein C8J56DRAFT_938635 [Mycena floridula]